MPYHKHEKLENRKVVLTLNVQTYAQLSDWRKYRSCMMCVARPQTFVGRTGKSYEIVSVGTGCRHRLAGQGRQNPLLAGTGHHVF